MNRTPKLDKTTTIPLQEQKPEKQDRFTFKPEKKRTLFEVVRDRKLAQEKVDQEQAEKKFKTECELKAKKEIATFDLEQLKKFLDNDKNIEYKTYKDIDKIKDEKEKNKLLLSSRDNRCLYYKYKYIMDIYKNLFYKRKEELINLINSKKDEDKNIFINTLSDLDKFIYKNYILKEQQKTETSPTTTATIFRFEPVVSTAIATATVEHQPNNKINNLKK
jgi:hypothetical protein